MIATRQKCECEHRLKVTYRVYISEHRLHIACRNDDSTIFESEKQRAPTELKPSVEEEQQQQKNHAPDNKPHTILLKALEWQRVTMKKTCEFGRK